MGLPNHKTGDSEDAMCVKEVRHVAIVTEVTVMLTDVKVVVGMHVLIKEVLETTSNLNSVEEWEELVVAAGVHLQAEDSALHHQLAPEVLARHHLVKHLTGIFS